MSIRVTITGDLGSGKSTVCRALQSKYHLSYFSTGVMQRKIAAEKGMSTYELNKYAETHPEIDRLIDGELAALSHASKDMVIDSRLAWHFVHHTFRVFLATDRTVAARRVMHDERGSSERYAALAEAREKLQARKKSENLRYMEIYEVNCMDFRNYDLVVDTTDIAPETAADHIMEQYAKWQKNQAYIKFWISPKCLYPTKSIKDIDLTAGTLDSVNPCDILISQEHFYIFDGHHRAAARIQSGEQLIPCALFAQGKDLVAGELSVDQYVEKEFSLTKATDWEDYNNFQYFSYPNCGA